MKEHEYKQFFNEYEKQMTERGKLHSRKVLRENLEKNLELNRKQQHDEQQLNRGLDEREAKSQYNHQQMKFDTHMHNKSMLDFKQRIQKQQKREHEQKLKEQRKKEESESSLLKVKQQQMELSHKKQYYADLEKQKFLKTFKDKNSRMLTKDELCKYKSILIS
jgi:hypothetical protein